MNNKKKVIIGIVAVIAVAVIGAGVYASGKLSKINKKEVNEETIQVDEKTEEELGEEYLNVAVFGVNTISEDEEAVDSDVVFVVSLNTKTKEVKLLPVYGNTFLEYNGEEVRMKDVYAKDGAEGAITLLNETLDLNIKDYVSVNFKALADAIDILGGVEIDVTKEEIPHINGYAQGIAELYSKKAPVVEKPGKQTLDGIQAAAYCRIRVTEGGDEKRVSRQRLIIEQMMKKLSDAKFAQMDNIMDVVFPQVETNFGASEMLAYGKDVASYKVETVPAFPRNIEKQERQKEEKDVQFTDYEEKVIGTDLKKDVEEIHKELFQK